MSVTRRVFFQPSSASLHGKSCSRTASTKSETGPSSVIGRATFGFAVFGFAFAVFGFAFAVFGFAFATFGFAVTFFGFAFATFGFAFAVFGLAFAVFGFAVTFFAVFGLAFAVLPFVAARFAVPMSASVCAKGRRVRQRSSGGRRRRFMALGSLPSSADRWAVGVIKKRACGPESTRADLSLSRVSSRNRC